MQENLCFVGGIPIITKFASKKYHPHIRLEAAAFVRQMYQTSILTLQMFVSCGGLNVLVEFLEEDYEAQKDLVLIGVNGIWSVFEMQGPTPKNDFCRIFSRSLVLQPLSIVLSHLLDEDGELSDLCAERVVNIFYLFSQAENHVKELVADRIVLKRKSHLTAPLVGFVDQSGFLGVLKDLERMAPAHQVVMLKFIKNLSMLSSTLDTLQNSNAIEVLTELLDRSRTAAHFKEISNQVLNTMYNLCRLSKSRQEEAAMNGIIPVLQSIVQTERPLKEFALPILCDMAHSGKRCRRLLWQNKGLEFYISLLLDPYWQVTALDAIFVWLQEETARVEEKLQSPSSIDALVRCFTTSKTNAFENTLEPLAKLLRLSPPIAHAVGRREFFARIVQKLSHNKAVVRLNLLKILTTICDASEQKEALIREYGMYPIVHRVSERDPAVLVRNMASDLVKACNEHAKSHSIHLPRRRQSHASSIGSSVPSASAVQSNRRHVSNLWDNNASLDMALGRPGSTRNHRSNSNSNSNGNGNSNSGLNSVSSTSSAGSRTPQPGTPQISRLRLRNSQGALGLRQTSGGSVGLPSSPLQTSSSSNGLSYSTSAIGVNGRYRAANNYVPRRHRVSAAAAAINSTTAGQELNLRDWAER